MTRRADFKGGHWFGIGMERPKTHQNLGTMFRSATAFGAGMVFTIGPRYYEPQASDTVRSWRHMPYIPYPDLGSFKDSRPYDTPVIGVEITEHAVSLPRFHHPNRALYLLGPEDGGLSDVAVGMCQDVVQIPTRFCLNVAAAGTVVMYDREAKR